MTIVFIDARDLTPGDIVSDNFIDSTCNGTVKRGERTVVVVTIFPERICRRGQWVECLVVRGVDPNRDEDRQNVRWIFTPRTRVAVNR